LNSSFIFAIDLQSKTENDIFEDNIANQDNFEEETKNVFMKKLYFYVLDYKIV